MRRLVLLPRPIQSFPGDDGRRPIVGRLAAGTAQLAAKQ